MNPKVKGVVFYVVLIGVAALLWTVIRNPPNPVKATYTQFLQQVQSGEVTSATIVASNSGANQIAYSVKDGRQARTVVPTDYRSVLEAMQEKMVNIEIRDASSQWLGMNAFPFLALLGFWVFMMSRLPGRDAK